jgi:hypothetical protein
MNPPTTSDLKNNPPKAPAMPSPRELLANLVSIFQNAPVNIVSDPIIQELLEPNNGPFQTRSLRTIRKLRTQAEGLNTPGKEISPEDQELAKNLLKAATKIEDLLKAKTKLPKPSPEKLEELQQEYELVGFTVHEWNKDPGFFHEEIESGALRNNSLRQDLLNEQIEWMLQTPEIREFQETIEALKAQALAELPEEQAKAILLHQEVERMAYEIQERDWGADSEPDDVNSPDPYYESYAKLAFERDQVPQQKLFAQATLDLRDKFKQLFLEKFPDKKPDGYQDPL